MYFSPGRRLGPSLPPPVACGGSPAPGERPTSQKIQNKNLILFSFFVGNAVFYF